MADDDSMLGLLRARLKAGGSEYPRCATLAEVGDFERAIDLTLPAFYRRLLAEVANGGFGPGFGLLGIPPDGYIDDDVAENLRDHYLKGRACAEATRRTPRGFLALCNWGGGVFSHVDCLSDRGAVVTDEAFEDRIEYTETSESLADWLLAWVRGDDLDAAMHRIVGYRETINPFTKLPIRIPIRERTGRRLELTDRI